MRPPPTPVPQKTPSSDSYGLPGAQLELRLGGHLHVVADVDGVPSCSESVAASSKVPSQPGRLRALPTVPAVSSTSPGEPTPMPASSSVSAPADLAASCMAATIWAATAVGPPSVGVG